MALSAYALTTVAKVKKFLHISDSDLYINAFTIYNSSGDASAATCEITDTTMVLIVTGGANAGTSTLTLADAANDTLTELSTVVAALSKGWVMNVLCSGSETSGDLKVTAATGCLLAANTITLDIVDNYLIEELINQATDMIEDFCGRQFSSRSYTKQRYNGTGTNRLYLKHYPITAVSRLAIGTNEIFGVKNTSTDATSAYVSASTTGLTLTVNGGTNDGSDISGLFASYATLTLLAAQIIAVGSGWTAEVLGDYGDYESSEILPCMNQSCLDGYTYLSISDDPEDDYVVDSDGCAIYTGAIFTQGFKNIIVDYTAGYSTVPAALELLCQELVAYYYHMSEKDPTMRSERLGDYSYTLGGNLVGGIPEHVAKRLTPYKRLVVL